MASIVLFHSALGLRSVEHKAADRMRRAGHDVATPDLYAGLSAASMDEGLALMGSVGWETICARARVALAPVPENALLVGHSMGAGVISEVWPDRRTVAGIVLLHALADIPETARRNMPVAVHVADPDPFAPPEQVAGWSTRASHADVAAEIFTYPGIGHFYTDEALPDYNAVATETTWSRVLTFLDKIAGGRGNGR